MQSILTPEEHAAVTAAIRAAEAETAGEIHCVLACRSDDYFYPAALAVAAALAVLGPAVAALLHAFWFIVPPWLFALAQLAAFTAAIGAVAAMPALRIALVPRRLRYRRAHDNALKQFLSRNIHRTEGRTGVLVFVSLAERYAEIVADAAIDDRVEQRVWDEIVAGLVADAAAGRLADGFRAAVNRVGAVLAAHFPVTGTDANELDDHLVEI